MAGYAAWMLMLVAVYAAFPGMRTLAWALIGGSGVTAIVAGVALHRPARSEPWLLLAAACLAEAAICSRQALGRERDLRGKILPVIDLAALLGTRRTQPPARLLVAESQGRQAGLAIDEVTEVGEFEEPAEEPNPRC